MCWRWRREPATERVQSALEADGVAKKDVWRSTSGPLADQLAQWAQQASTAGHAQARFIFPLIGVAESLEGACRNECVAHCRPVSTSRCLCPPGGAVVDPALGQRFWTDSSRHRIALQGPDGVRWVSDPALSVNAGHIALMCASTLPLVIVTGGHRSAGPCGRASGASGLSLANGPQFGRPRAPPAGVRYHGTHSRCWLIKHFHHG